MIKELKSDKEIIFDKNENLVVQLKNLKKTYNDIKIFKDVSINKKNITIEKIGDVKLIYLITDNYPPKEMKLFIDDQKRINDKKAIIALISRNENKVSLIIGLTNDLVNNFDAKFLVKKSSIIVGGNGGGGRNDLAQAGGTLPEKAKDIYSELKNEILKLT